MLIRSYITDIDQKKFQIAIWFGFSLAQCLVLAGVDKSLSGAAMMITTIMLASMYYLRYKSSKAK